MKISRFNQIALAAVLAAALAGREARADESICSSDGTYYVHWTLESPLPPPYRAYNIAACGSGVVYAQDQSSQIWVSDDYASTWTKVGPAPANANQLGCSGIWDGSDLLYVYDYDEFTGTLWAARNTPGIPLSWSNVTSLPTLSLFGAGPSMFVVGTPYGGSTQNAQTGTIPFSFSPNPVPTDWRSSGNIPNSGHGATAVSPVLAANQDVSTNVDDQVNAPRIFVADFFADRVSFADGQMDPEGYFTGYYQNWQNLPKPTSIEPVGIGAENPTVVYVIQYGGNRRRNPVWPLWRAYIVSQNCNPNSTW
jgi:hypothetical protein